MAVAIALLLLVAVAAAGFVARRWLSGRLALFKDHSKKQEELNADGVEIVVQKHERRLRLALPDLSSVQIRSPVGPMKSSIRSALKELRSRQMVQSLCSKFESRMKVTSDAEESTKDATKAVDVELKQTEQPARARRRDARDATVAPVLLASELAKEAEITANARSNNLNKFLRSYASNLDNAVTAERRVSMSSDAISVERRVVMSTDAEDDVEQPLLASTEDEVEAASPPREPCADSNDSSMELGTISVCSCFQPAFSVSERLFLAELDLHTLQLESEFSNQCDSPPTVGSEEEAEVAVLVEATDCDEGFGESDEGNNSSRFSTAFTLPDFSSDDAFKQSAPETARSIDSKPETCTAPPAKLALSRFKQQVPSNGRRAHTIATLNI
ncbi:unnamed protein product [Phytophthora lilii]|uniref:Unnamed protein product n=1 Tax=Phytophthora lilii TaxID=2077276 RepID=A0A9W6TDX3_9STRA|nr:unnamed protein product [Phytophthora lilii]